MIAKTDSLLLRGILVHTAATEHTNMVGVYVEKERNNWLKFAVEIMPGGYICFCTTLILNSFYH